MAKWDGRDAEFELERFKWLSPVGLVLLFAAGLFAAVWMSRCGDTVNVNLEPTGGVVRSESGQNALAPVALELTRPQAKVDLRLTA